jgi:ATP:ADP antiporter, AAA family
MAHWMQMLLHLRRGDLARGLLLSLYYFLIISGYTAGLAARDTLFLDQFQATQLPYADMATALLVGLFVAIYIRLARHASLRNLLVGTLLFLATNAAFFGWAAHFPRWRWLYPALYIWVGIFGVVTTAQVWTLANYLLTTREAKRLFGLIGSGGILGGICSGFYTRAAAKQFGTESLLYAIALFLTLCPLIVILAWRKRKGSGAET